MIMIFFRRVSLSVPCRVAVLAVLSALVPRSARATEDDRLRQDYRATYDAQVKTIAEKYAAKDPERLAQDVAALTRRYLESLSALKNRLVAENRMDNAARVENDMRRATFLLEDTLSQIEPEDDPEPPVVCERCQGKRKILDSCPHCKGTTKCAGCKGTGDMPKVAGAKTTIRHALCRGTGKCAPCWGTGKMEVPCPVCSPTRHRAAMPAPDEAE